MFLSWWYLKANSMKSGQYGTFLCHIYFFFFFFLWAGRGSEHFVPVTWFLSWSRVNESSSMSPFQIFPWKKTLHTTIITKIFHVRDVLECKTWIPPPPTPPPLPPLYTPFGNFYFGEWFYELNHFLLLFSKTRQSESICSVSTLSSIACLPCITYNAHLLNLSSCVLGEEFRHLISM